MPAVLRNGRTVGSPVKEKDSEPAQEQTYTPMAAASHTRPTLALLLIYPVILGLGSLFSVLSPSAVPPTNPGVTSDLNAPSFFHNTNYFAGKRNIVNLYFVKIGWFWTTLAFALLQATTRPPLSNTRRHYLQSALRYSLVTLSWIFTTQWCFGPALIDRSFTITGGHCEPELINTVDLERTVRLASINSSTTCKLAGGRWRGGHDISGHVFMLVLSSAFLIYELYIADRASAHPSVSPQAAAALAHDMTEEERKAVGGWESESLARVRIWARYFLYGVTALDLWMLMMTAIWFHTWLEKLSGLLIAAVTVWATYFAGDFLPQWRATVGGL